MSTRRARIKELRAELEALIAEHKDKLKDTNTTPEDNFQRVTRISMLRLDLAQLERGKIGR